MCAHAAYEKAFDGPAAAYEAKAARAAEEYAASMKSAEDSYRTDTDDAYQQYINAVGPAGAKLSQAEADADKEFDSTVSAAFDKYMTSAAMIYSDPAEPVRMYYGIVVGAITGWISAMTSAWAAYDAVEAPAYEAYCKAFDAAGDSYDGKAAAAGKAYAEALGSAQSEYDEAVKGIAAGAQAAWEAAAQAAWSTYATQYNAAAAAYNGALVAADAAYNAVADGADAALSGVYAAANAAAQSALDSASDSLVTAEGIAWTAYLGSAAAADAAWTASEEQAWEACLGASGVPGGQGAPTAGNASAGDTNANAPAVKQSGTENTTPASGSGPPAHGTTVSGTTSIITENLPDGTPRPPYRGNGLGPSGPADTSTPSTSGDMKADTRTGRQKYMDDLQKRMHSGRDEDRVAAINESMSGRPTGAPTAKDVQNAVEGVAAALAGVRSQRGRYTGVGSVAPNNVFGKSIPDLSKAGSVPDRGGLSAAGRSLTKHGAGARPVNSLFPKATGNPAQINAQSQTIVDDILNNPATTFSKGFRGRFGDTIEAVAPDGRGIVFDINGKFLFFKE